MGEDSPDHHGADESTDEPTDEDHWPDRPALPAYVLDPLDRQPADRLEAVAAYARELAAYKRDDEGDGGGGGDANSAGDGDEDDSRADSSDASAASRDRPDAVGAETLESLAGRGVSTDPDAYDGVPESGSYVTIKETKPGYRYYYWQWREGDTWKNRYIAPVEGDG
jgi:hypothetical protein